MNGFFVAFIISLAVVMVTTSASPASAQEDAAEPPAGSDAKEAAAPAPDSDDAAPAPEETGAPAEPKPEGDAEPEPEETESDEAASAPEEEEPEGEPEADADSETEEQKESTASEASKFFAALRVRQLPPEAYPVYKTRGLEGGSLWQTFHGLQWPYMPQSGIGFSGYGWVDTGYEQINRPEGPSLFDEKYILAQGRFVLRVTPTFTRGRWFIQAQSEFAANLAQAPVIDKAVVEVDDLWVRFGMWNLWDLQVGRYEAWELYHFGMGMDLNTLERRGATDSSGLSVPEIYGATFAYYRPPGLGNVAAHVYPTDFLRFELLGQLGNDAGLNTGTFRGAGILDFGFVKVKGGGEYKKQKAYNNTSFEERDERGFGGTVQFVIDPYVEFGGSGGWAITDRIDAQNRKDEEASVTTWSAGGFLNVRLIQELLLGGGGNYTRKWDIHRDEDGYVGEFSHIQVFGALQYRLFGQLYLKGVFAWAKGHFAPSFTENDPYDNTMLSGRVRLQYNF